MTIDEKLASLFDASPSPVPALGARAYGQTAPERPTLPYLVFTLVGRIPMHTQDQQSEGRPTRRWSYQAAIYDSDRDRAIATRIAVSDFLNGISEPNGLQRIIVVDEGEGWTEKQRLNQQLVVLDIMESL